VLKALAVSESRWKGVNFAGGVVYYREANDLRIRMEFLPRVWLLKGLVIGFEGFGGFGIEVEAIVNFCEE
jgi:hypothetical protein